jgi:hypothetical protein
MKPTTYYLKGWKFERVSATYIDITPPNCHSPAEVINCWDYAEGRPAVPDTYDDLKDTADEWLRSTPEHDRQAYAEAARYHDRIKHATIRTEADRIANALTQAVQVDHLDDETVDMVLRILTDAGY